MKALVLAEKPSVARDIARVLGCHRNLPGAIEGPRYIVTWALGHLVTLADPEAYDPRFKEWKMDYLPMVPEKWELVVIRQTAKQYGHVKAQLLRKDVDQIIIATDAGREGELVARWILDRSGCHKTHQTALDLFRYRQGHPGGIRPHKGGPPVRSSLSRGKKPG